MLPDEALKSMKVMFATPCYISAVSMHYVTSIFELTHHCNRFGLECILHMHSESLITRSRNKMVLKFLSDETLTHLFWIDSDITFTPQSVCRLLLIDRDITAGVYPMKDFNWPATCRRITRSAAAGATSAARSGSICNASCFISGSTISAATSPRACASRAAGESVPPRRRSNVRG